MNPSTHAALAAATPVEPGSSVRPRLTLVICTYNNASVLAQTLAHIEEQSVESPSDVAVLVIDNNCTDDTARVVAEASARGRVPGLLRIVETRQGQVFARVRGVLESRSEWVAFIDDDNFLQPGWIAGALDFIAAHPRCGAFGGRIEIIWQKTPSAVLKANSYAYASLDLGDAPRRLEGETRWRLRGAGLVCKVEALVASGWTEWQACTGRQCGATTSGDDLEMVMRIAREGYQIWYEPACHMRHFISASRISQPYIERLHLGFGLAHPLLIGFKRRQSMARWAYYLLKSSVREFGRFAQKSIQGWRDPFSRDEARLRWAYLRGTLAATPRALLMPPSIRARWLGQTRAAAPAHTPLVPLVPPPLMGDEA